MILWWREESGNAREATSRLTLAIYRRLPPYCIAPEACVSYTRIPFCGCFATQGHCSFSPVYTTQPSSPSRSLSLKLKGYSPNCPIAVEIITSVPSLPQYFLIQTQAAEHCILLATTVACLWKSYLRQRTDSHTAHAAHSYVHSCIYINSVRTTRLTLRTLPLWER